MRYRKKPLGSVLPKAKDDWTFESPMGALIFRQLHALAEFGAGRPSSFGICQAREDLPLMMAYLLRRSQVQEVEAKVQKRKSEDAQVKQSLWQRFKRK